MASVIVYKMMDYDDGHKVGAREGWAIMHGVFWPSLIKFLGNIVLVIKHE